ncbi:hypothetical protein N7478_003767 [Penicillium angulare]|uniref:uncharacterized protein n=1 Tax=Penicillium angulare TaxID=116970 RepID=UPI00253F68F0|nr:uncharacterized protein N7478_003767 [Penicillium angulare]KAJ5288081.1 hypothetical protein N7478_003767 [Penicillium angulare]
MSPNESSNLPESSIHAHICDVFSEENISRVRLRINMKQELLRIDPKLGATLYLWHTAAISFWHEVLTDVQYAKQFHEESRVSYYRQSDDRTFNLEVMEHDMISFFASLDVCLIVPWGFFYSLRASQNDLMGQLQPLDWSLDIAADALVRGIGRLWEVQLKRAHSCHLHIRGGLVSQFWVGAQARNVGEALDKPQSTAGLSNESLYD